MNKHFTERPNFTGWRIRQFAWRNSECVPALLVERYRVPLRKRLRAQVWFVKKPDSELTPMQHFLIALILAASTVLGGWYVMTMVVMP